MFEVAHAGKGHHHTEFVGFVDRVLVTHTASGLYNSRHTILRCQSNRIIEGEETVRTEYQVES